MNKEAILLNNGSSFQVATVKERKKNAPLAKMPIKLLLMVANAVGTFTKSSAPVIVWHTSSHLAHTFPRDVQIRAR